MSHKIKHKVSKGVKLKWCYKCKQWVPIDSFGKSSREWDDLQKKCKSCRKEESRQRYINNREYFNKYLELNKESIKIKQSIYRIKNLEHIKKLSKNYRENNAEAIARGKKEYRISTPSRHVARSIRHTHLSDQVPKWLTQRHHDRMDFYYHVRDALKEITGVNYHVDHIIPLKGKNVTGLHIPWNLQVITQRDNNKKYNKIPHN